MDGKRQCVAAAEDRFFAGDFAGAAARVRPACDDDPGDPQLWFLLGYYLACGGELDAAARALREVLAIDPDHGMAHHQLANCLRDMHELGLATTQYRRALDVIDDEPDTIADFGLCHLRAGDLELAAALFRRALNLDPASELAVRGLEALGGMDVAPAEPGHAPSPFEVQVVTRIEPQVEAPVMAPSADFAQDPVSPWESGANLPPDASGEGEAPPAPVVPPPSQLPRRDRRLGGPAARMAGAGS